MEKQLGDVQRDSDRLGEMARRIEKYTTEGQERSLQDAMAQADRATQAVVEKKNEAKELVKKREKLTVNLHSKEKMTMTMQVLRSGR